MSWRQAYGSLMESPRTRASNSLTCQLFALAAIAFLGILFLFPLYQALNHRKPSVGPKHIRLPWQSSQWQPTLHDSVSQPSSIGASTGSAEPSMLEEPIWRRSPVRTAIAATKVMNASQSQQSGSVIDASRAQDQYQSSIDTLTAGGHMGEAVFEATSASSKPKEEPVVKVSPRLRHAVELAASEHANGYRLTGGIRPRNQQSKKSVQALKSLRGGRASQKGFVQ